MVYTGKSVSSFFLCWFFVLRVRGDFSRCMDALFAASAGVRIVLAAGAWARCFLFLCAQRVFLRRAVYWVRGTFVGCQTLNVP